MTISKPRSRSILAAVVLGAFIAPAALAASGTSVTTPSGVSESAPARAGKATVPSGGGNKPLAGTESAYPPSTPSAASATAPGTSGSASTPTQGQGASAPPPKQDAMNRLPKTPSSVSESAPARTGKSTVPTAKGSGKTRKKQSVSAQFDRADADKDGKLDRAEFERYVSRARR